MSQVTISGAISNLDTSGIISQLVAVQRNQQTVLTSQQATVQKRADALSALATSLTSLGTLAADLAKTSSWSGTTVSSSSSTVAVTSTATTAASITFDVLAVATPHTLISADSYGSTGTVIAGAGFLTLTKDDGTTTDIDVGGGSLAEVVSGINAAGAGITATAVRTGPASYRLQVSATTAGAASSFTLANFDVDEGVEALNVLAEGSDARIKVGKNPLTAYEVTAPTNTFRDLVPGLSFTVSKEESGVTVSAKVDGSTVAEKVGKLVDSANAILADIAAKSTRDSKTKTVGPFTGESSVRVLQQNILTTVSSSGAAGVQLTREGRLSFDSSAFLAAFAADPARVARGFGAAGTFTPADPGVTGTTMTVTSAAKTTRPGTYDIQVDTAPAREQWAFDVGDEIEGSTFALIRGDTTLSFFADTGATLADVAAGLNARSIAAGFGVTASVEDTVLLLTADSAGAGPAFTATMDDVEGEQIVGGADIEGSIDGQAATGLGNVLALPTGTGGAVGLAVAIGTSDEDLAITGGALGTLAYAPGLAQRLTTLVSAATATSTGGVSNGRDSATAEVKRYQAAIDAWDTRLEAYRQSLVRQFTAMETALAKLKSSTSALSGLIKSTQSDSES